MTDLLGGLGNISNFGLVIEEAKLIIEFLADEFADLIIGDGCSGAKGIDSTITSSVAMGKSMSGQR